MDYLDKNFSYWLRMTLHKITFTYEKIVLGLIEHTCFHGNHYFLLVNLQVESDFNTRHAHAGLFQAISMINLSRQREPKCRRLLSW